jgi:hypothetical protein
MAQKPLEQLTFSEFSKLVHARFRIQVNASLTVEMVFVEATHHGAGSAGWNSGSQRTETFSLYFVGPPQAQLPQQIYTLTHPEHGDLELFLVPIEKIKEGIKYEAAFNRIIPS